MGTVVHLTMYGENLPNAIGQLESKKLMVVVGAEKNTKTCTDSRITT